MDNYKNTWGRYPWHPSDGEYLIHPDDRKDNLEEKLMKKVLYCSGLTNDGYLILHDTYQTYRVKPEIYLTVPTPIFKYHDTVQDRENSERIGTIRNIEWHQKYSKEFYNLSINGRDSTKRYFAEDLQLVKAYE